MPFQDDVSLYCDPAVFGTAGTLAGVAVTGILDDPEIEHDNLGYGGIDSFNPKYWLPTASVPAAWLNATLVLPSGTFSVREHRPDGNGFSVLILSTSA